MAKSRQTRTCYFNHQRIYLTVACIVLYLHFSVGKPTNADEPGPNGVVHMEAAPPGEELPLPPPEEVPEAAQPRVLEESFPQEVVAELPENAEHNHADGEGEGCEECREAEKQALREAEQKRQEDLKKFEAQAALNVHDAASRAVAEQMKNRPYEAGDMEKLMHGGHDVHGESQGHDQKETGVDMSDFLGQPEPEPEEKQVDPGTLDADDFLHSDAEGHDHNPHDEKEVKEEQLPLAEVPDDVMANPKRREQEFGANMADMMAMDGGDNRDDTVVKSVQDLDNPSSEEREDIGINVEKLVHGEDHVHEGDVTEEVTDEDGNVHVKKLGKKIRYDDVLALGLSKDDLKGIDINKLLSEDEVEYKDWKKEMKDGEGGNKNDGSMSFWDQLDDLRRRYFGSESKAKQVKEISKVDADDVEWERSEGDDDRDSVHEGESQLEHDMELWGSTVGKGDRRPYKEIRGEDL